MTVCSSYHVNGNDSL